MGLTGSLFSESVLKFIEYVQLSEVFKKARCNNVLLYLAKDTGQRNGPIVRGPGCCFVMSMMMSFCAVPFPTTCLGWDLELNNFTVIDRRISFYSQNTNLLPRKPKISCRYLKSVNEEFHRIRDEVLVLVHVLVLTRVLKQKPKYL